MLPLPPQDRRRLALISVLTIHLSEDPHGWAEEEGSGRDGLRGMLDAVSDASLRAMSRQDESVLQRLRAARDIARQRGVPTPAGAGPAGAGLGGAEMEAEEPAGADVADAEAAATASRGWIQTYILESLLWRMRHDSLRDGWGTLARMVAAMTDEDRERLAADLLLEPDVEQLAAEWDDALAAGRMHLELADLLVATAERDLFRRAFVWCAAGGAPHYALQAIRHREAVALAALQSADLAPLLQHADPRVREAVLRFSGRLGVRAVGAGDASEVPSQAPPETPPPPSSAARRR
jgi:hypothetical protein